MLATARGPDLLLTFRIAAAALLAILATLLLLMSATTPFQLDESVEDNRAIKTAFERTAAFASDYAKREGRLPDDTILDRWTQAQAFGWFSSSISLDPVGCGQEGFVKEKADEFILGLWRGEWFECFAFPSGKTTLLTSREAFLRAGAESATTWFLLGCLFAWLAWRTGRRAYSDATSPGLRSRMPRRYDRE